MPKQMQLTDILYSSGETAMALSGGRVRVGRLTDIEIAQSFSKMMVSVFVDGQLDKFIVVLGLLIFTLLSGQIAGVKVIFTP